MRRTPTLNPQKYIGFRSNFRFRVYMLKEPQRAEREQRGIEDSISKIEDSISKIPSRHSIDIRCRRDDDKMNHTELQLRLNCVHVQICIKTIFEISRKVELIYDIFQKTNGGNDVYLIFMFILWSTNLYQLYLHAYILDLLCRPMWIGSNFKDSSLSGGCEYIIICPDKIRYSYNNNR